jgi:glycosyltransferase involved in cell wall biosynthesis
MRGRTVIVQNPSMVLAALACLFKARFGYSLVVDRHSNFGYLAGAGAGLKRRLSDLLSDYTLRGADLTIVTNRELADHVERAGGRPFVLPDPFPELDAHLPDARDPAAWAARDGSARAPLEVLFVSSWAFDEPIAETIEACRRLQGEVTVRITGKVRSAYARLLEGAPPNFKPTGFLSDREYFDLMARSDAVMAVTSRAATLVCGGYEGAAMGKPLILGNSGALRGYFDSGCVYTDGSAGDLVNQLRLLRGERKAFTRAIRLFHARRKLEWDGRLAELEAILEGLAARG